MTRKKLVLIIAVAALVMVAAAAYYFFVSVPSSATPAPVVEERVTVQPLPRHIEVADTPQKRVQGLSGREVVEDDYGMLFIFDVEGRSGFWMKDMRVPIDIIWISAQGTIVHIEHSLSPDTYPEIFTPPYPARYVLETKAGYARTHNWTYGTKLDLASY